VLLVDPRHSVAFDTRDEQDHEDALTTTAEKWSPSDRVCAPLHPILRSI